MPRPERTDLSSLLSWEEGFFNSRFTHPSGFGKLTTHPGGFIGLWTGLVGNQEFPVHYLARSTQTIEEFIDAYVDAREQRDPLFVTKRFLMFQESLTKALTDEAEEPPEEF